MGLTEVFTLREIGEELTFLKPETEIELFDRSPGSSAEGSWLPAKIRKRVMYKDARGKTVVGYEVDAPWTVGGSKDIEVADHGRTWRLREEK
jgi:hypothetical protein